MSVVPPNAFIGRTEAPAEAEVGEVLGASKLVWDRLLAELAAEFGVADLEWRSYSPKAGWSLRVKKGKRTIVWMSPCAGCMRIVFILGERAIATARQGSLPARVIQLIDGAEHYPEGAGIRLNVKTVRDLPTLKKLVEIKLLK